MDPRQPSELQHTGTLPLSGQEPMGVPAPDAGSARPAWLEEARSGISSPGRYLAYEEDERVRVVMLQEGWTRVGRSLSAHVRFDDPTVSRRHALVNYQEDAVRILDDRSLNGVFVNGDRVDMRTLADGDEVTIGRFRLYFLSLSEAEVRGRAGDAPRALA